jgi:hypothetical protein
MKKHLEWYTNVCAQSHPWFNDAYGLLLSPTSVPLTLSGPTKGQMIVLARLSQVEARGESILSYIHRFKIRCYPGWLVHFTSYE